MPERPNRVSHADKCGSEANQSFQWRKLLAGGLGFEPRLTESESAVLPLNYPPPRKALAADLRAQDASRHVRGADSRAERGRYRRFRAHGPPPRMRRRGRD